MPADRLEAAIFAQRRTFLLFSLQVRFSCLRRDFHHRESPRKL